MALVSTKQTPLLPVALLVTGNVLGVGILALPIKTGLSGYVPTLLGIIVLWLVMCFTACVIAKRIHKAKDGSNSFDIPSFFHDELGIVGRWLATIANLVLLYGVLTAYLSMIASMFYALFGAHFLSTDAIICLYFIITCLLTAFGMKVLRRSNIFIMLVLWTCFIVLLIMSSQQFSASRLSPMHWGLLSAGLPIIVSAFHFHNIVPTVCRQLDYNYCRIRKAIYLGTFIGFIMNVAWVTIVLGGLPMFHGVHDSIHYAFAHGEPATVPLSLEIHSHFFTLVGCIFALFSVTASYMANGTGLLGFIKDLTHTYLKTDNRLLAVCLSFLPPLVIALVDPNVFLKALSIVGGIGEIILFGILPAIVVFKSLIHRDGKERNIIALPNVLILLLSSYILIYVIMHQFF